MTLETILLQLYEIDRMAQTLIRETGFNSDSGFGSQVRLESNDTDERFSRDCLELCLEPLELLHQDLSSVLDPYGYELSVFESPPVPLAATALEVIS